MGALFKKIDWLLMKSSISCPRKRVIKGWCLSRQTCPKLMTRFLGIFFRLCWSILTSIVLGLNGSCNVFLMSHWAFYSMETHVVPSNLLGGWGKVIHFHLTSSSYYQKSSPSWFFKLKTKVVLRVLKYLMVAPGSLTYCLWMIFFSLEWRISTLLEVWMNA